jgi:transposase
LLAESLEPDDQVAVETTGNAVGIARILEPHVGGVLIVDTRHLRAITHAKLKNDRVDARCLADLLAAGMLPGVWRCDEATRVRRRKVARRTQLVPGRARAKNQIHAALIRQLEGRAPGRDLFGKQGRRWLAELNLPADERLTVESCLREADFLAGEIAAIDRDLPREALSDADVKQLMTIPGVDMVTAITLMSAIGDIRRFRSPRHLVGYVGLDPRVRQSGSGPARHGHISKQGSTAARHVLCEAAHSTMRAPGPLRAFGQRVRTRRGAPIATVAIARKLTTLAWHMLTKEQDYLYERPALTFRKLRRLELTAGAAPRSNPGGRHGPGTPHNPPQGPASVPPPSLSKPATATASTAGELKVRLATRSSVPQPACATTHSAIPTEPRSSSTSDWKPKALNPT